MDLESKTILMHSFGELYMIYGTTFIQLSKASLGIWGKTQTITRPTDINLAAESNAIPMHTAYQTLGQSLLGMPHADITYKMSLCGQDQCHPNAQFLSNTKPVPTRNTVC